MSDYRDGWNAAMDALRSACLEYIEALKSHRDADGNLTGEDFNIFEIGAVEDVLRTIEDRRMKS